MASECVEPDARCYRFAAEACLGTGDDGKQSPEAERLLGLARRLEASRESVDLGAKEDESSVDNSALDLLDATTLGALLETSLGEDFSGFGSDV